MNDSWLINFLQEVVNPIQLYIPQPLLGQQCFWILGAAPQHHPMSLCGRAFVLGWALLVYQ